MDLVIIILLILIAFTALFVYTLKTSKKSKQCPPNKLMIITGSKLGNDKYGNPLPYIATQSTYDIKTHFQRVHYLDLNPIKIPFNIPNLLSQDGVNIKMRGHFTVRIGTVEPYVKAAAQHLCDLSQDKITQLADNILYEQLRFISSAKTLKDIDSDYDDYLGQITKRTRTKLKNIGLELIDLTIEEMDDDAGQLYALAQERENAENT